ncbi:MAG TPA: hypothetical protein VHN11_20120 [Xanthobacteraceae bacterium]|jgi:hypothetical protein|nr:hypothetical protein [Xanthobacteraceae bacterium]
MNTRNRLASIGLAGAVVAAAVAPSWAAPVATNAAAVKNAVPADVTDVRWHHHHGVWPGAIIGGLALGALAAATAPRYYYYDTPAYYYGPPYAAYGGPVIVHRPYWHHRWYRWHHW